MPICQQAGHLTLMQMLVVQVNTAGHVELFSHDDTQRIHSITAVNEYKGNLYLGHLGTDYVAEVHLKALQ